MNAIIMHLIIAGFFLTFTHHHAVVKQEGVDGKGGRDEEANDYKNDGPKSSLGIGLSLDDVVEPHQEFTRRFTKGIRKLAGNMPEKDHRTYHKNAGVCRIRWDFEDKADLKRAGFRATDGGWTAQAYGCTTHTIFSGLLSVVTPPTLTVVPPIPEFYE
ncbi:hypothetical protein B296_00017394 [Ensete ventricosum]|uniref:Uncharacterized protein n=1 Tax=Ensete ventricosum TaxID=4639 RepID=A0A427ATJ4_ENSVE|nr:hypothetical protein B296_00017394 [Ensete ventricosum]